VLAAVEAPELLDMKKFNINSLNYPGSNAVPLVSRSVSFFNYMKNNHFSYFAVQSSSAPTLTNSSRNIYQINQSPLLGVETFFSNTVCPIKNFADISIMKICHS
jgi:hypothetical protein